MKSSDSSRCSAKEKAPLCMPDLPLPTPPPMANIMMTSRFDLQTRGGCGYRRILSSRSSEFRSPILSRTGAFQQIGNDVQYRSPSLAGRFDRLGLSPLPRHKNFDDLSKRLEDFDDYHHQFKCDATTLSASSQSKYLSRDSVLSQELEEVNNLSIELRNKFNEDETSPEYQSVFYNEHYMSDIDENEEIKQFSIGYKIAAERRRHSDQSEKNLNLPEKNFNYSTLPSNASFKCIKSAALSQFVHTSSSSSIKSSDYYLNSPLLGSRKVVEVFSTEQQQSHRIIKTPFRPVVKIATVR